MAAQPSAAEQPTDRLYVGNLSWSVTDDSLRQEFVSMGFNPQDSKVRSRLKDPFALATPQEKQAGGPPPGRPGHLPGQRLTPLTPTFSARL